ncbi:MAG: hypothetical protein PUF49_04970 [Firmicutes bacterium]|nr:hypothetical protein [Bacillota bacterium]
MTYYDESGKVISEDKIDLVHGWLEDKEIKHHDTIPAKTHVVEKQITKDFKLTMTVTDEPEKPAYDEVISRIYHYTGQTKEEKTDEVLSAMQVSVSQLKTEAEAIPTTMQSKIDESLTPIQEAIAEVYEMVIPTEGTK